MAPPTLFESPSFRSTTSVSGALPEGTLTSLRIANQLVGVGLLEAVAEEQILERADPQDLDGDGISGRPNRVWNLDRQVTALGRFGWKANQPDVLQQVASAFFADMGITNRLFPVDACRADDLACERQMLHDGSFDINSDDLAKVVLYTRALAVPAQRNHTAPNVQRGRALFFDLGCETCHRARMTTAEHPTIPALSNQSIKPYSDMLLHDMGPGLADGRPDFEATGSEWRTPPLWGIGLIRVVNKHTFFLHDGRARNLQEAILWHGGEALAAQQSYLNLPRRDREALLAFLESL